MEEMICERSEF